MSELHERYEILSELGSGAHGTVFLALDRELNRQVAIKTLKAGVSDDVFVRFQKEAKAAGSLKHPGIVTVLDFGMSEGEMPYLVMDYANGVSLAQRLKSGPLSLNEAIELVAQIADALNYAHTQGLVHRDIKPSNVFVTAGTDGQPVARLIDFGIARLQADSQRLTQTGAAIGSPLYMSPEQTEGRSVDGRSDIYSLGCLLFETLTGRPPFRGETAMETMALHRTGAVPSLFSSNTLSRLAEDDSKNSELLTDLDDVISRCLAKDPSARYQKADLVSISLRSLLEKADTREEEVEDSEPAKAESSLRGFRFNPSVLFWICLVLAACYLCAPKLLSVISEPNVEQKKKSDVGFLSHTKDFPSELVGLDDIRNTRSNEDEITFERPEVATVGYYVGDDEIARLSANRSLRVLVLKRNMRATGECFKAFGQSEINEIILDESNMRSVAFENLFRFRCLKILHAASMEVMSDDILKRIGALKQIDNLVLDSAEKISDAGVKELSNLQALDYLAIRRSPHVTNGSLPTLKSFKKLTFLRVDGSGIDADGLLDYFRSRNTLRGCALSGQQVDARVLKALGRCPMKNLIITDTHLSNELIRNIAGLGGLTGLELEKCKIEGDDISAIIKQNPDLKIINLRGTTIGDTSVNALAQSRLEEIEFCIETPTKDVKKICQSARNLKRVSLGDSNFRTPGETLEEIRREEIRSQAL